MTGVIVTGVTARIFGSNILGQWVGNTGWRELYLIEQGIMKIKKNVSRKTYLAVLLGKNNKIGGRHVGLKSRSCGRLGREEVDMRQEEQSVVESSCCVWNSENKNEGTVSQNTTVLLDVNEMTCFGLLGHYQVAKFYDTKYCLCVADVEISSSGQTNYI